MSQSLPTSTRVVIVGGGIVGCSLAYHLTQLGWKDVLVLEQNRLAGGTTWHAAGLVGRLRTTSTLTRINKLSAELYAGLEALTGHPVGWKQVGSLIVARSQERLTQLRRTAAMSEWFGVEVQLVGPEVVRDRWPLLRTDDLLGAAWLPHDGKVIPQEVTRALAIAARNEGATVVEGVRVTGVLHRDGRATGVVTSHGRVDAEVVVLCGGMWTRDLAQRCGVHIPLHPVEHHYVVTEPIEGAFDELPVGRDPDLCLYFRGEGDALVLGAFQAESKAWTVDRVPDDFSFQLLEPDWERFAEPLRHGRHRIPALEHARFARFVNGPESFTPDNQFLLGETAELRGLFVGAGFNSVGIASAGGAGKYLAEWIVGGEPSLDLWTVDVRRFGPWAANRAYLRARVVEVLGLHYQLAWPNREPATARDIRRSPLHETLARAGACFGVKNGWERPNWFARAAGHPVPSPVPNTPYAPEPTVAYAFGRQNWFANHAAEHRACRESVALFDQSAFGKLMVEGPDAFPFLQRLCGANLDVPAGRIVYTGMFNARGGFESDLTAIRLAHDRYLLITGTAQPTRDLDRLQRHLRPDDRAACFDLTAAQGVLGVMGPNARRLLQSVTDADLSPEAFPFGAARPIAIGPVTALAARITYVGELGWELHLPVEQTQHAYEVLRDAGRHLGLADAGHYAIQSLRLEKACRAWGAELSPDDTPFEAGLAFAIDWNHDFLGRQALLEQKARGWNRQLATFVLRDPGPVLWGSELILRHGKPVGYTSSGAYGHTLGAAVAMGYVHASDRISAEFLDAGDYAIVVDGAPVPATLHRRAPHDPDRRRILA
ncbi:MAG: GcvT family protein [Verrucomicrobiae bacterium]|nr:GcvT family protein [Verrucomicrobiae bacterium]